MTNAIQTYSCKVNDADIVLYDTPGLCDTADAANDEKYLACIREVINDVDLAFFVAPLNETRVSRDERIALRSLSASLGKELWENMIVVFTFACSQLPGELGYSDFFATREASLRDFVAEVSRSEQIAKDLPVIAVDNSNAITPDGTAWLPELFTLITERCAEKGLVPLIEALGPDVDTEGQANQSSQSSESAKRINLDDSQRERVKQSLKRSIITGALIGVAATAVVAGGIGGIPIAIAGGLTGAAYAFVKWVSR